MSDDENEYKLFYGKFDFKYFNNFFKKSNVLRGNSEKRFLGGRIIFLGEEGHLTPKMNITCFIKN